MAVVPVKILEVDLRPSRAVGILNNTAEDDESNDARCTFNLNLGSLNFGPNMLRSVPAHLCVGRNDPCVQWCEDD